MIFSFFLLSEVADDYIFLTAKTLLLDHLNQNSHEKVLSQIGNLWDGFHVVILSNLFFLKNA